MGKFFQKLYFTCCVEYPFVALIFSIAVVTGFGIFADRFQLDASADSLLLENDKDLEYYRSIRARYGSDDFLVVTFTPHSDLFSDSALRVLEQLQSDISKIDRVESITSILNVPLIDSPRVSLSELLKQIRTLQTPGTDKSLAKQEFLTSPLYKNLLLSKDAQTTALLVNFKRDQKYRELLEKRNKLREKKLTGKLAADEEQQLKAAEATFKDYSASLMEQEREDIRQIRGIINKYEKHAEIFLGGIPMIVADMIKFISHDIQTFGIGVLIFIILLLSVSFKKPRWVIVPMVICFFSGVGMIGYLGLLEWRVTVVSSNFISLLLIITLSLIVHLIVRYQELHEDQSNAEKSTLIIDTIKSKATPSFYTAITTMVAFGSLLFSGIRPVIDFGWMMVYGVALAFVLTFLLFPSLLIFLNPGKPVRRKHDFTAKVTGGLAVLIEKYTRTTIALYIVLVIAAIAGISQLSVENRFIDYFKDDTEINRGMIIIDKKLGGTTPLDVVLDPDQDFREFMSTSVESGDDFEISDGQSAGISGNSYWFNIFQLESVEKIHQYLEQLPETGKVLSLSTTMQMLTHINQGEKLDNFSLAIMHKRLPDDIKQRLFEPYMSNDGNQVRFAVRIYETDKNLKRDDLLEKIRQDLTEKFNLEKSQVHLTGMAVLYNNLLQSLYQSQILTIGVVFLAILLMFILLFKSFYIASLAIVPNIVAAGLVLGIMGLAGISLDIMTITIAAITIGIAVDDTIHFIHRFMEEYSKDRDYWASVKRCHKSIGRAMYYTSITITLGFSILALSNFMPTIYFGLLTGFAMIVAMVANLTLLPILLVKFKALGR